MIEIRNLEKSYPLAAGRVYVLRNINLTIQEGEFASIMGPSGAGKSTLLHILGMHDGEFTGDYEFRGELVNKLKPRDRQELQKRNIGFVFQSFHLLDDLTVYENLEIPLSYRDMPKKERESVV
jgi:putative ABC transport system ATP-binding protein